MEKIIKQEKKSAKPYYAVALLWLIATCFFPMHKGITYLILIVVSIILYFELKKYLPKEYENIVLYTSDTGNEEYDAILKEAHALVSDLQISLTSITDAQALTSFTSILQNSKAIIEQVTKNPQQISKIRKFFSYYLPTIVKVSNTYAHLSSLPIQEENIKNSLEQITNALPMLENTFAKLLDSLFSSHNIDISSELSAFETIVNLDVNLVEEGEMFNEAK